MYRPLVFALACLACGASHASSLGEKCIGRAPGLADSLTARDYVNANRQLGPIMDSMFSPDTLKLNWEGMLHEDGAYQSHGAPYMVQDDGKDAFVRVPLKFARRTNTMQIVCSKDSGGQIDSLSFF